jgi:hypothetical protein
MQQSVSASSSSSSGASRAACVSSASSSWGAGALRTAWDPGGAWTSPLVMRVQLAWALPMALACMVARGVVGKAGVGAAEGGGWVEPRGAGVAHRAGSLAAAAAVAHSSSTGVLGVQVVLGPAVVGHSRSSKAHPGLLQLPMEAHHLLQVGLACLVGQVDSRTQAAASSSNSTMLLAAVAGVHRQQGRVGAAAAPTPHAMVATAAAAAVVAAAAALPQAAAMQALLLPVLLPARRQLAAMVPVLLGLPSGTVTGSRHSLKGAVEAGLVAAAKGAGVAGQDPLARPVRPRWCMCRRASKRSSSLLRLESV